MQTGVEPLRRIRRDHLAREHITLLVKEGLRVFFGFEIAALPAPIGPATGEAIKHLLGAHLGAIAFFLRQSGKSSLIGNRTPQE